MKILDRYIAKTLLKYSLSVMVILVGIYAFFKFLEEVDNIGHASYTLLDAMIYIGLSTPSIVYLLSSLIILLGAILGLGQLASNSELIIMRSAGISIVEITKTTLKISLLFVVVMIFIGEFIAPLSTDYAKAYRAHALGEKVVSFNQQGFWIKDGGQFIHIDKNIDGTEFIDVTLITPNNTGQLNSVLFSKKANFNGKKIVFENPSIYQIDASKPIAKIDKKILSQHTIKVEFDQESILSLKKEPKELSTLQLFRHVMFLSNNDLFSGAHEVELYSRIVKPLTLIAMIILSISFVFSSLRDSTLGRKIFLGVALSLFFELSSRIGSALSLRLDYNHFLIALLPTLVVLIFALILLKRKSA